MPLNKLIPDQVGPITRQTAITIADILAWLQENRGEALKAAFNAVGINNAKKAANELDAACEWWR